MSYDKEMEIKEKLMTTLPGCANPGQCAEHQITKYDEAFPRDEVDPKDYIKIYLPSNEEERRKTLIDLEDNVGVIVRIKEGKAIIAPYKPVKSASEVGKFPPALLGTKEVCDSGIGYKCNCSKSKPAEKCNCYANLYNGTHFRDCPQFRGGEPAEPKKCTKSCNGKNYPECHKLSPPDYESWLNIENLKNGTYRESLKPKAPQPQVAGWEFNFLNWFYETHRYSEKSDITKNLVGYIQKLLQTAREDATKREYDRWADQPANKHDNKIKDLARSQVIDEAVALAEKWFCVSPENEDVKIPARSNNEAFEGFLKDVLQLKGQE